MKKHGVEIETKPVSVRLRMDVIDMLDELVADVPYIKTRGALMTKLIHDAWVMKNSGKGGVYKPMTVMDKEQKTKERKALETQREWEEQLGICEELDGEYDEARKTCVFYNYDRVGRAIVRARQEISVKKLSRPLIMRAFGQGGREQMLADWARAEEEGLAETIQKRS